MRDGWYSDGRDLLKWAALAHLANREQLRAVVQVAMFRPSKRPTLETGLGTIAIPEAVWAHFRDILSVRGLGAIGGFDVSVFDAPFASNGRAAYFDVVAETLRKMPDSKAVLLDPDTGFEPGVRNAKHVTAKDVRVTWDALGERDWLLLYQHRWRHVQWKEDAVARFRDACGGATVEVFRASATPSDVILLAARKAGGPQGLTGN
jgi:hypothetical protein